MIISDVIDHVKAFCGGLNYETGEKINDATTRDKVLYGGTNQECTGIVTCIWPTADVIRNAQNLGANLIISHEALFWNHGDHQDIIAGNTTYLSKKNLLDKWGGVVWRCHDYIHSKVPIDSNDSLVDGIFYGFAAKLGWLEYRIGDTSMPMEFEIPEMSGRELATLLVQKLGLNGTRITGDADACIRRVHIPMHIFGTPNDTNEINYVDAHSIDALITMEFVDFTTCEYIRDAGMLGQGKCAITVGHFNLEEPGMEYMVTWLPTALGTSDIPVTFVGMTDTYEYVTREGIHA
ncbi:Nif3-like dinuclear metal center hexameric protein [Atopobium sp. oral taxon 810]|uniref:Nif3-like dinuclear metal center hexameric protein n=1 Tax=Atopobium sp. oral taxon 810 TaxID=712158 RepID=UPI00039858AF|nr:Nif3-like dinuclear metal center hexameric protein [Atopobium sp. oral taxon 810]ERI05116.1 hypothetical protein HMPREF9069_01038 [Atopobium sp. oral taxon 810 str. F0209]